MFNKRITRHSSKAKRMIAQAEKRGLKKHEVKVEKNKRQKSGKRFSFFTRFFTRLGSLLRRNWNFSTLTKENKEKLSSFEDAFISIFNTPISKVQHWNTLVQLIQLIGNEPGTKVVDKLDFEGMQNTELYKIHMVLNKLKKAGVSAENLKKLAEDYGGEGSLYFEAANVLENLDAAVKSELAERAIKPVEVSEEGIQALGEIPSKLSGIIEQHFGGFSKIDYQKPQSDEFCKALDSLAALDPLDKTNPSIIATDKEGNSLHVSVQFLTKDLPRNFKQIIITDEKGEEIPLFDESPTPSEKKSEAENAAAHYQWKLKQLEKLKDHLKKNFAMPKDEDAFNEVLLNVSDLLTQRTNGLLTRMMGRDPLNYPLKLKSGECFYPLRYSDGHKGKIPEGTSRVITWKIGKDNDGNILIRVGDVTKKPPAIMINGVGIRAVAASDNAKISIPILASVNSNNGDVRFVPGETLVSLEPATHFTNDYQKNMAGNDEPFLMNKEE